MENYSKRTASSNLICYIPSLNNNTKNIYLQLKKYLQVKVRAIGTIGTPSYTNILMDHFEGKFIYSFIKAFSFIYLRIIDDIFLYGHAVKHIWKKILRELNTKHLSIKFEFKILKERISFLDTEIYIKTKKYIPKYLEKNRSNLS